MLLREALLHPRAFLLLGALHAQATTWNVNSSQSTATIQGVITGASAGDSVVFAAGTYSISAALNLQCGITYTGPSATPATAILNATFTRMTSEIFKLAASSCSQMTTIEYFEFENATGIYVNTSFSNLTISYNQFVDIPCCQTYVDPTTAGIYFDAASGTPATEILTNATITHNQIGDSTSCITPNNAMTNYSSPETIQGNCQAIGFYSSVNGLTINYNTIGPVGEGVHFLCVSDQCEPTGSPAGATTQNVTAEFNDFVGIHRIAWEEQPQATKNVVFEYNSEHDPTNPYFGNFALSLACCDTGATSPGINVSNNTLIQNVAPHVRYGYGIEAWGLNGIYSNNLIQNGSTLSGSGTNPQGIAWCYGMSGGTVSNNTVQGPNYNTSSNPAGGNNYIGNENVNSPGCGVATPWSPSTLTGNLTSTTISAVVSVAPTIYPSPERSPFLLPLRSRMLAIPGGHSL